MNIQPKYRLLTKEELKPLDKEFVDFLIINGITADDWVALKKDNPHKAEDIIALFSDVVFESILRKTMFLEYRDSKTIKTFQCLKEKIILVGLDSEEDLDLTQIKDLSASISRENAGLKIYTTEKSYLKIREVELFDMIQSGCAISDGATFKALSLCLVK